MAVDDVGGEGGDRCAFAFEGDLVVALRHGDGVVVHQLTEDVDGGSGVRVALGVGVAEGIGVDQGAVEGEAAAGDVGAFGVEFRQGVDPGAQGLADVVGAEVPVGALVAEGGEEVSIAAGRELEVVAAGLPAADVLRGGGSDRQTAAVAAPFAVVPDQGGLVVVGLQAVAGQGGDFQGRRPVSRRRM